MAGIEITDEMTSEQLEAMTGGEQLKAEVHTVDSETDVISSFGFLSHIYMTGLVLNMFWYTVIMSVIWFTGRLLWPD